MIELIAISDVYGDCTMDYELGIPPNTMVKDILNYAKEHEVWGEIIINGKEVYSGRFINMNIPDELMNKYVQRADCTGGWGYMRYHIHLV